jgi:hypothetical protein
MTTRLPLHPHHDQPAPSLADACQHDRRRTAWWAALALALLLGIALLSPRQALAEARVERLQVADPYIEIHTGPGRGFPVFHVATRSEWIEVVMRRTDWFKLRTADGREGWAHRAQLESTLTEGGVTKTFRDVLLDDYLKRRLEMGTAFGRFKGEPMLKVWTGYRFADALSAELTIGQVQGTFSGTDFWHANLMAEPWSDQRLSPFVAVGFGKFKNVPNASLVSAITVNTTMADASLGLRYHLSDRFVARLDYTTYTAFVSDRQSREFNSVSVGLSFFF